jgi:signal transduction histidine kinase
MAMATSDDTSGADVSRPVRPEWATTDEPSPAETYWLALGALGAALMTLVFDHQGPVTVLMLSLALVPWALIAGSIRVPTWLFVAWTVAPAAAIVAAENAGGPIFFGVLAVTRVFSLTASWVTRTATIAAALVLPVVLVIVDEGSLADSGAQYFTAGLGVGALSGHQFHRQRELTARLRWSLTQLDAAAAAEERRRVARDVHDVVAHSLTVVLLNVSGARKALATHPDLAAEALDRAENVGRESLDGIRRVVGLLRAGDEQAVGPPQPTARDLPAVIEQQRQAGADVELDVTGELDALEPLAGAALVRITQEALTNAQRHAPGAPIRVQVAVSPGRVTVAVHNGPAQRTPLDSEGGRQGLGLLGMRERVEALGGSFAAGPADDGWVLTGEIPLTSTNHASSSTSSNSGTSSASGGSR